MGRTLAVLPAALLLAFAFVQLRFGRKESLPPSPPGSLLFGNALEIRKAKSLWIKLAELAKLYAARGRPIGPIFTLRLPLSPVVVVSDVETVNELFDKRSVNFSNRPVLPMVHLSGWGDRVIFTQYNQTWRLYRKLMHRALNSQIAPDYQEIQLFEVKRLMKRLVDDPSNFFSHVQLMAGSISLRIAYGYTVQGPRDKFIVASEDIMAAVREATVPGYWLVDTIPLLRFLPSWFPGAYFKRKAAQWARMTVEHRTAPFEYVLDSIAQGAAKKSFVSRLLEPESGTGVTASIEEKELIKPLASAIYDGGVDTTSGLIQSFFLAMVLYPEVQKRAQLEIDSYFSMNKEDTRALTLDDKQHLPYVRALATEVPRWHPVTNVAVHNSGAKEEHAFGYCIPPGTMVIANIWALLHDESMYAEPTVFKPDRFVGDHPAPDPTLYAFGFGRRACPGVHLAQQSLWLTISNILAHFAITKARDERGIEITPEEKYTTSSVMSRPSPFRCSVTPRSNLLPSMIHDIEE